MNNIYPKLSIGLPVYNGEAFIAVAIESLLAQTFQDFELIIADNASTDQTQEICQTYAAKDKRIRYYRNSYNIGCAGNFNRVFELSSAEYFKWVAYDDLHDPSFVQKCIDILERDPSIVLCHSRARFINAEGQETHDYNIHLKTDSPRPEERFHELLSNHLCYQLYGVIRSFALKNIPLMGSHGASDAIFLLRLGIFGRFYEIPEYLFFPRVHPQQSLSMFFPNYMSLNGGKAKYSLQSLPDFHAYTVWFDSSTQGKIIFPHGRVFWEYLRSIWIVKMNLYQRLCCHLSVLRRFITGFSLLFKDILVAYRSIWRKIPKISISIKVEIIH